MPNPERLLRTLQEAVKAFRATTGRTGRVVNVPVGADVLVAGDLHGNLENFRLLLHRAALESHPQRHLVLQEIIHGRFLHPEGGDKSHQLLDLVAALKCQFPQRVHFLLGNHELAQWRQQRIGKGDADLNVSFREGLETSYGPHAAAIYEAYQQIFASANLAVRTANRVFLSHSLPAAKHLDSFSLADLQRDDVREADLVLGGAIHSLVWGRDTRLDTAEAFLKKVDADLLITGHIPCENGYDVPNGRQLILDCLGAPACYCLFPTDGPLTLADLIGYVGTL